jgi:predicted aspartyl protease
MPSRRHLMLALSAAALAPRAAFAQALDPLPDDIPDALIGAGADRHDRLTIPVMIGQAGPFDFVVDTGADRSVLAQDIADQLALPPGRDVLVQGVTGAEMAPTVAAPPLNLGQITLNSLDLPVLPRERLGVDGLLGVDALQKRRLVMDFQARRLEILPAGGARSPGPRRRDAFVPARDRFGRLVVIDANANEADIGVFVDSGSGLTIANRALARAIRAGGDWREPAQTFPIQGVTSHEVHGEVRVLASLRLGGLRFTDVPMLVADLDLFDRWGLGDRPTLLLGINVLRLFSRVEMDYSRRRMMFRVGADPQIWRA